MCLICGMINIENSNEKILTILKKLEYRGQDGVGIFTNNQLHFNKEFETLKKEINIEKSSKITLAHRLFSIVNFSPQPFENEEFVFLANCEIYNWMTLNSTFKLNAKSDSELLFKLFLKFEFDNFSKFRKKIIGPFAIAIYNKKTNELFLARDIIGEKPLFYYFNKDNNKFAFASEKKGLMDFTQKEKIFELNPRQNLIYDISNSRINFIENPLIYDNTLLEISYEKLKKETLELLESAILKQVPKGQKFGVLFSGGIDSTFICYILKKLNIDFIAYTSKLVGGNISDASDYIYAKEIAKKYGFPLKVAEIKIGELEKGIKEIINLIEEREYIKVSVALPFYFSAIKAKEDGIKVMFSGLGSEELFAGYRRHKKVKDINLECYKGILTLHTRDLYRDDVILMANNQELRLPFLDINLIKYSFRIPVKFKLDLETGRSKIILRDIAKEIGIDEEYSERPKKAAQYGSKFDKGILRLAKNVNMQKQEFLNNLEL